MANYNDLKTSIQNVIKQNGANQITGNILQQTLLSMINSLGANYTFAGVATPSTNPGTPDQNVFYIASENGVYTNFGNIRINKGELCVITYNGSWSKRSVNMSDFTDLGSTNFIKDAYDISTDSNISFTGSPKIVENSTFPYVGKSILYESKTTGTGDYRINLNTLPSYLKDGDVLRVKAEVCIKDCPSPALNTVKILLNGTKALSNTEVQYNTNGKYIFSASFVYDPSITRVSIFAIRYNAPAVIEFGRVYIGYDSEGSMYGDYNVYERLNDLSKGIEDAKTSIQEFKNNINSELDEFEKSMSVQASYNFINNVFNIPDANLNLLNGKTIDNTKFNYNGKAYEFKGVSSGVTDCRVVLQKLPSDVRVGAKIKIVAEIFAENIPSNGFVVFSALINSQMLQSKNIRNGYSIYVAKDIEVTEQMKNAQYSSAVLFFPIQDFAYPGVITIGRVYIGYDTEGSMYGDYNVYKRLNEADNKIDAVRTNVNSFKINNTRNFICSQTDINIDRAVAFFGAEIVENTMFDYSGKMVKFSGENQLKDCRAFLRYLPRWVRIGMKVKILAEVYIEGDYANIASIVSNHVNSTVRYNAGYNVVEYNGIEVDSALYNLQNMCLGIFIPLQAGSTNVYVGRVYIGLDGYGSMIGDENMKLQIEDLSDLKEKINYLSNASSPNVAVSPNGQRYILTVNDEGTISAEKVSCKKILFLGNSFVSHSPNASLGWTPTESWGMSAETKEKDFVHRLSAKIKGVVPSSEIAGIVNIVPFEQNPSGYDLSSYDYINQIDFDCVVLKIGENITSENWSYIAEKTIELLDNHILVGKKNVPVFVASHFTAITPFNSIERYNEILKNISDHYSTPFAFISVNSGTNTNIYNASTTPLPPKSNGEQWNKSEVNEAVIYGHPGNIGHEYIAEKFFEAIKLYYRL